MSSKNEAPHLGDYFFRKIDDFPYLVNKAKTLDPQRVDDLMKSRQNLCDVIDSLQDIIDSDDDML